MDCQIDVEELEVPAALQLRSGGAYRGFQLPILSPEALGVRRDDGDAAQVLVSPVERLGDGESRGFGERERMKVTVRGRWKSDR